MTHLVIYFGIIFGATILALPVLRGMGEEVARAGRREVSMSVGGADDQQKKGRNEEEDVRSSAHAHEDAGSAGC